MGFFDKLRALGGPRRTPPPVLIRVRGADGSVPDTVTIEATWSPSRERDRKTAWTAQGLCIIPWRAGASAVEIVLRSGGGIARMRADVSDYDGAAEPLVLVTEKLAAEKPEM